MFISRLCQQLTVEKINYALVGGYAVALHGAVRGTVDIDFVIKWEKEQLIAVENCMHALGLVSRLPINAANLFQFRDEYIQNRNLIAWNFYHPKDASQQVDLIINFPLSSFTEIRIPNILTFSLITANALNMGSSRPVGRVLPIFNVSGFYFSFLIALLSTKDLICVIATLLS